MKLVIALVLAVAGLASAAEKKKPYYLPSYESSLSSGFAAPYGAGTPGGMQGSAALAGAPGQTMMHPQQGVVSNTAMYTAGAVNPYSVDTGLYYKQGARFRAMHGASDFAAENNVFSKEQLRKAAGKASTGAEARFAQQMPSAYGSGMGAGMGPGQGMMGPGQGMMGPGQGMMGPGQGMTGPGAQQQPGMMGQQQQQMWGGQTGGGAPPSDLMQEGSGAGMLPSAYSKAQREKMAKTVASERASAAKPAAKAAAKPAAAAK